MRERIIRSIPRTRKRRNGTEMADKEKKEMKTEGVPFVSVIVPVYNEERYIDECVRSMLAQDYPKDRMEWFFADGMSQDRTVEILEGYRAEHPGLINIIENPDRTVPYAMNLGIRASRGEYIIRLDAHAVYAPDYFFACVRVLERTGADNVGGAIETRARTKTGKTIAKMLSSKFGVGNSGFRTGADDGYVDTVPFGAFKRDVFDRVGLYDERLTRNQDSEMNYRIIHNGGKIYLSNEIKLAYYCRDTVKGIAKMAFLNGKWNIITSKLCPGSMRLRHFVPCIFVLSLIALPLAGLIALPFLGALRNLFLWALAAELAAYLALDAIFSAKLAANAGEFFKLAGLFPIFHVAYGAGSIAGILSLGKVEK